MCRIFGFRSVIQSQVHQSLVHAENALRIQSERHPDGWGVAYYHAGTPHVIKSERSAVNDHIFRHISGVVSSETVVAHIRKTTVGQNSIINTHPFQFGPWVFVHNGNIKNFSSFKDQLVSQINPELRRFIFGETDSEVIFYFLLSQLSNKIDLSRKDCPIELLAKSLRDSLNLIQNIIGSYSTNNSGPTDDTYLTFLITNGATMIAHQGGKHLYYSTYKKRCSDRASCTSYSEVCENPSSSGQINHLIFSSEPLSGDNIWLSMQDGDLLGVDWKMKLTNFSK